MDISKSIATYTDKELNKMLLGKYVEITTNDIKYIGVVTGFMNAAQWNDPERKIMNIILNDEIILSIFDVNIKFKP